MQPVIDTHFHVFEANQTVGPARYSPTYSAHIADWQTQAADAGITHGVVVQTSFRGVDNTYVLNALSSDPARLRGVVTLESSGDKNLDRHRLSELHQQGVRGIRLNLAGGLHSSDRWLSSLPGQATLWDEAAQLGWHIELHTDAGALPQVLAQLPSYVPLLIDHFGKPLSSTVVDPSIQAMAKRAKQGPMRIKISAPYRLPQGVNIDPKTLANVLLHELGSDNLMWGSDWPCTNHEKHCKLAGLLTQAQAWFDEGLHKAIFFDNAFAWYWSVGRDET